MYDEAFEYIEREVNYFLQRKEGKSPIEAAALIADKYAPAFYIKVLSELYEPSYQRWLRRLQSESV